MIYISRIIIPLITLIVIIYGLIKKIDIYDTFIEGVKEGLNISLDIFPSMFAMIISVTVLVKSNIITDLMKCLLYIHNYHFYWLILPYIIFCLP